MTFCDFFAIMCPTYFERSPNELQTIQEIDREMFPACARVYALLRLIRWNTVIRVLDEFFAAGGNALDTAS